MRGKLHLVTPWIATILAMRIISMTAKLATVATSVPTHAMEPQLVPLSVLVHVEAAFHGCAVLWLVRTLPTMIPRGFLLRLLGPVQHLPCLEDELATGCTLTSVTERLLLENFSAHRLTLRAGWSLPFGLIVARVLLCALGLLLWLGRLRLPIFARAEGHSGCLSRHQR